MIRLFKKTDYPLINCWWKACNEIAPTLEMLPEETTFIVEKNHLPVISACLYLTNCKEVCYIENLIADPNYQESDRKELIQNLFNFLQHYAKNLGYKRLLCFAYKDKLKERYQEIGLTMTLNNVASFVKGL